MRPFLFLSIMIFTLAPWVARAEYRAFTLVITDTRSQQTRLVTSTFDHLQYPGYHPLRSWETVAIQDTWMCWGRQGDFKPICANPKTTAQAGPSTKSARAPAGAPAKP